VCDGGGYYPLNALSGETAVVADPLDVEEIWVDVAIYEGKIDKIREILSDIEVLGIIDGGLCSECWIIFEVLFHLRLLVVDVQAGLDTVCE
jgi:hypothetical protein